MDGKRGDDEAAESAVIFVGVGTDKTGIGAGWVAAGQFGILGITILPEGESLRVGHLGLALRNSLREGRDDGFAVLGDRSLIRVHDCVSVRATVTGAHDDAFVT